MTEIPSAEEISPSVVLSNTPLPVSLYIGDLDPNVKETQLLELFKTCGTVINLRVCRDIISQRSLGYGYVNFQSPAEALKALEMLNYKEVGARRIRLMLQQRDPSLRYSGTGNIFVKNLELEVDSKGLHELFKAFGTILSCKVMAGEDGKSRRYGFVHFKDEVAASSAIQKLNGTKNGDDAMYVAHFIRRNARIAALMANFTNVYIKQVLPSVDKQSIEIFFAKFGGITSAAAKKDSKGRVFAFCNFNSHDDAVKCIESIHDKAVDGLTAAEEKIYVQRAQPRSERLVELRQKYMQRQSLGNNLYVRNFDQEFADTNLRELFQEFGEIRSCKVMTDDKGSSRGFGFVSFCHADMANNALREMNGRMLNGKPLVVNIAQRRDQRYSLLQVQFHQRMANLIQRMNQMNQIASNPPPQAPPVRRTQHHKPPATRQHVNRPTVEPTLQQAFPSATVGSHQLYTAAKSPLNQPALPETPTLAPITAADLSKMSLEDQKIAVGERLYIKVQEIDFKLAPKITGMFLELDPLEVLQLLDNPATLSEKVKEALAVLHVHHMQGISNKSLK